MVQYAPYTADMNVGQGYNTYMQEVCVNKAVTVTAGASPPAPYNRTYRSTLVTNYKQLIESLHITAGAAISGWNQSGKVDVDYLDRKEFESSDITYEVKVDVEHQGKATNTYSFNWHDTQEPNRTYGDRFIADFVRGGHYYALVRITSKSDAHTQDVKHAAEITMNMYGAEGKITEDVKAALETLHKYSKTSIVIDETGGGRNLHEGNADTALEAGLELRSFAYGDGGNIDVDRAILEKYENVPDFKSKFQPFDYFVPIQKSWPFLDEFSRYMYFQSLIENIPGGKFIGGDQDKVSFENLRVTEILEIRDDPTKADYTQPQTPATKFRTTVLLAVKTATWIAQRIPTPKGGLSDSIQPTLQYGATKLFDVNVYDFDGVDGTRLVSFGSNLKADSYMATVDLHTNSIAGWKEDSYFYVFTTDVEQVTGDLVRVSSLASRNYIRVGRQAAYSSAPMFRRETQSVAAASGELFTFRGGKA
ncbi:hypothetical protein F5I97DRAFT_1992119 [Phlebopus sp. FC_14]|nr:hypothetical protein F5I97DRAFT_1992119 [Phlebopus sp. FC_14]